MTDYQAFRTPLPWWQYEGIPGLQVIDEDDPEVYEQFLRLMGIRPDASPPQPAAFAGPSGAQAGFSRA